MAKQFSIIMDLEGVTEGQRALDDLESRVRRVTGRGSELEEALSNVVPQDLGAEAQKEFDQVQASLRTLGVQSDRTAQARIAKLTQAFEQVKNSGVASSREIRAAQRRLDDQIRRINGGLDGQISRFRRSREQADRLKKLLAAGLGVAAIAGVTRAATGAARAIDDLASGTAAEVEELQRRAEELGVSLEGFTRLASVARQSGVEVDSLTDGLADAVERLGEIDSLGSDAAESIREGFQTLEIDPSGIDNALDLLSRVRQARDDLSPERFQFGVRQIFGDQGSRAILRLADVSDQEFRERAGFAEDVGAVLGGGEDLERALELLEARRRLAESFRGLRREAGLEISPELTEFFDNLTEFVLNNEDALSGGIAAIAEAFIDLANSLAVFLAETDPEQIESVVKGIVQSIASLPQSLQEIATQLERIATGPIADFLQSPGQATAEAGKNAALGILQGEADLFGRILSGRLLAGFAEGGAVSGPGTPTSDSIVARLSDGEYVQQAAAHRRYGTDAMDAINAGAVPVGGLRALIGDPPAPAAAPTAPSGGAPGFAAGGAVSAGRPVNVTTGSGRVFRLGGDRRTVDALERELAAEDLLADGSLPPFERGA